MAPRRFGPYELQELLGRGGMGEVHRAVDTVKSRTVALKLLPSHLSGDEDVQARFRREAQVAARLNDPHVIPIHDYGELHGRLFLDMRYVAGVDLARTLADEGAVEPRRAVDIVSQVADALDAAHADGLVHRDVKPSNVLLTPSGSGDFVYLIDFGIAAGSMVGPRLTATGLAVGTAAYMAPERFTDVTDADRCVDVYALGCVLHELLTGDTPFDGTTFPNLMYQHLHAPPPRPSAHDPRLGAFDGVVATALAKEPRQRHPSAGALATAARAAIAPARQAPAPSTPQRPVQSSIPTAHGYAPPPPPRSAPPVPAPPAAPRRKPWRVFSAVAAIVVHAIWALFSLAGTVATFSDCSTSSVACGGGVVGLVALAVGLGGIGSAILALTTRGWDRPRVLGLSWALFGVAFVLLMVTALLGSAATRA